MNSPIPVPNLSTISTKLAINFMELHTIGTKLATSTTNLQKVLRRVYLNQYGFATTDGS
jgi:hypothetical protein